MNDFAEYILHKCYSPIPYQSVRSDFLGWYYRAADENDLEDELSVSDTELVDLVIDSGRAAKKVDSDLQAIEMIEGIDKIISKIEVIFAYIKVFLAICGLSAAIVVVSVMESLILGGVVGAVFLLPATLPGAIYTVFKHQIKSNSQFLAEHNKNLIIKSGEANKEGRNRSQLISFYLWNRSLSRPKSHLVITLLAVLKVVCSDLYGSISVELREQVGEFVGKNGKEIIKTEIRRALKGEFGSYENFRESHEKNK